MIDRYWKGNKRIFDCDDLAGKDVEKIIYELNNQEINPLYKLYYIIKPILPRFLQIFIRRLRANLIIEQGYESIEKIYHESLIKSMASTAEPFRFIWFWPRRRDMACIVTHDIETLVGFKKVLQLADIDAQYKIKASFKFVPEGYRIDYGIIKELKNRGFEIAIHGLNHDGKLFISKKMFQQKLIKIEEYANKWHAEGFRSPSLLRTYKLMKNFKFNWDSSFPDWDPYGPQPGGCRTIFPYFISDYCVELPVTLMQDHTLFNILNKKDISIWRRKFNYIKSLYGLANIIVHPDYIFNNNHLKHYYEYLDFINREYNVWHTYPNEVANWWRKRDKLSIKAGPNNTLLITGLGSMDATIADALVDNGRLVFQY